MKKIQLYSLATPNGQKVSVALEEMELPYEAHVVNIMQGEQFLESFVKINPNSKIPAIVDGDQAIFESGAILMHLAEKSGKFLSPEPKERMQTMQWLFFQVGGIGPMFGQFGHFYKYAKDKCDHPYPLERYTKETQRLLGVLEKHLEGRSFMVGESYSIADMAIFPWVLCLDKFYHAGEYLGLKHFKNVNDWLQRILAREATVRGLAVCSLD